MQIEKLFKDAEKVFLLINQKRKEIFLDSNEDFSNSIGVSFRTEKEADSIIAKFKRSMDIEVIEYLH